PSATRKPFAMAMSTMSTAITSAMALTASAVIFRRTYRLRMLYDRGSAIFFDLNLSMIVVELSYATWPRHCRLFQTQRHRDTEVYAGKAFSVCALELQIP